MTESGICEPLCRAHSGITQSITNLEGWQRTQNGALGDLRKEVSSLRWWIMSTLATALLSVALLAAQLLAGGR